MLGRDGVSGGRPERAEGEGARGLLHLCRPLPHQRLRGPSSDALPVPSTAQGSAPLSRVAHKAHKVQGERAIKRRAFNDKAWFYFGKSECMVKKSHLLVLVNYRKGMGQPPPHQTASLIIFKAAVTIFWGRVAARQYTFILLPQPNPGV